MFIELAEFLRCPLRHEPRTYAVLVPARMVGRDVVTGVIACPVCRREYPIVDGVADLRDPGASVPDPPGAPGPLPPAATVQALLGLGGPGGYVVLVGSAGTLAPALEPLLEGVHLVLVDAPDDVPRSPGMSALRGGERLPLQSAMARGVVIGAERARAPWLAEGARLLLRGLRLVVLAERVEVPGVGRLASGGDMWVGQRG